MSKASSASERAARQTRAARAGDRRAHSRPSVRPSVHPSLSFNKPTVQHVDQQRLPQALQHIITPPPIDILVPIEIHRQRPTQPKDRPRRPQRLRGAQTARAHQGTGQGCVPHPPASSPLIRRRRLRSPPKSEPISRARSFPIASDRPVPSFACPDALQQTIELMKQPDNMAKMEVSARV